MSVKRRGGGFQLKEVIPIDILVKMVVATFSSHQMGAGWHLHAQLTIKHNYSCSLQREEKLLNLVNMKPPSVPMCGQKTDQESFLLLRNLGQMKKRRHEKTVMMRFSWMKGQTGNRLVAGITFGS